MTEQVKQSLQKALEEMPNPYPKLLCVSTSASAPPMINRDWTMWEDWHQKLLEILERIK